MTRITEDSFVGGVLHGRSARSAFRSGLVHPMQDAVQNIGALGRAAFGKRKKTVQEQGQDDVIDAMTDPGVRYRARMYVDDIQPETERAGQKHWAVMTYTYAIGFAAILALTFYETMPGFNRIAFLAVSLAVLTKVHQSAFYNYMIRTRTLPGSHGLVRFTLSPWLWMPEFPARPKKGPPTITMRRGG